MNNSTTTQLEFAPLKGKKITALFDEPHVSTDGGVLLLREVDRQLGLMDRLAEVISDNRRASYVAPPYSPPSIHRSRSSWRSPAP
jgi:hypothetical protein